MGCSKCGKCCEAIRIGLNLQDLIESSKIGNTDAQFVLKNWIMITEEAALEINPVLKKWMDVDKLGDRGHTWFACTLYDQGKKLCTIFNKPERPQVCAKYPFYEDRTLSKRELFYSQNCGFKL